jgi:hypothetical protein
MKKLLFLVLPLFFFSCKGTEQYRAGIEELSGSWESATTSLTDFSSMVSGEFAKYTNSIAGMQPDEATLAGMEPEQRDAVENTRMTVIEALKGYPALEKNIKGFVNIWTEKSEMLTSLKDGLSAGKLEGDVSEKLSELSALVTTANENIDTWKGTHDMIKSNVQEAMTKFSEAMAALNPKPNM